MSVTATTYANRTLKAGHFTDEMRAADVRSLHVVGAELPAVLPGNLQVLDVDRVPLTELPAVPPSVHTLTLRNTRIACVPDLSHLTNLESLSLYGGSVVSIDRPLPASLRTLVLDHNKIRYIDYVVLPEELASLTVSYNFLEEPPPPRWRQGYDHNNYAVAVYVRTVLTNHDARSVYTDPQNVHDGAVQDNVRRSIAAIMAMHPGVKYQSGYLLELCWWCGFARWWNPATWCAAGLLATWCADTTVTATGETFDALLERVWQIVKRHEHRGELQKRLRQELDESRGMCFTGRVGRVVNALSGYVDGLGLQISQRAEMQNRILVLMARLEKGVVKRADAVAAMKALLAEYVVEPAEADAWIEAVRDARPMGV